MKVFGFFNTSGGMGQTTLLYHLAWMFADHGIRTLAVDLDPQANLTAMFLNDERLESLWSNDENIQTVYGAIGPVLQGAGDIANPHVEMISSNIGLICGDIALSRFEDALINAWSRCHNRDEFAFRTITAFSRLIQMGGGYLGADLVLIDVGRVNAIIRSALIAAEQFCITLAPNLFSLLGMKNLGATLREGCTIWAELLEKAPDDFSTFENTMKPAGYIVIQPGIFGNRPIEAYQRWMRQIPHVYRDAVLNESIQSLPTVEQDPYCLSLLRHYKSLMAMAMEVRKPIFFLKSADGAIGAHIEAVKSCYKDFRQLAARIAASAGIEFS
ncbi:MAG: ParA family protein [Desulfatirhabdiaceae bacterium]